MDDPDLFFPALFQQQAQREDTATFVRDITEADLVALAQPQDIKPLPIQKLRSSHHFLARLLAEGRKPAECQLMTGYSLSRISILQGDPTFRELVEHYRQQVQEIYLDVHQRLAALGLSSVEELQDRLDQEPEGFRNRDLMELAALTLDRAGYGPRSTVQHNHRAVIMTDATLARIKEEAEARRQGVIRTIEEGGGAVDSFPHSAVTIREEESAGSESEGPGIRAELLPPPTEKDPE